MRAPDPLERSLQPWLQYINRVHGAEIDLGLARSRRVARRLEVLKPATTVVMVAGTNGKGSVAACLEAALVQAGCGTACYTSPHLETFNERIRINGKPLPDAAIVKALAAVETARDEVSLSYFEFATLAALYLFTRQVVDFAVLEVGMGGRLDAVNMVEPQLSIITRIDLDHQQWLGHDRDTIALEKAGILRPGVPLVCADPDPPASLLRRAAALDCPCYQVGHEFDLCRQADQRWCWRLTDNRGESLAIETDIPPRLAPVNVVSAVQSLLLLGAPVPLSRMLAACAATSAPGRQEWRKDRASGRQVLLDVAHNPSAMRWLTETLAATGESGRLLVVLAVLADKAIQDMARCLDCYTDIWYIAQVDESRGMGAAETARQIRQSGSRQPLQQFSNVRQAYQAACAAAAEADLILVTGSFHTVAAVRSMTCAA